MRTERVSTVLRVAAHERGVARWHAIVAGSLRGPLSSSALVELLRRTPQGADAAVWMGGERWLRAGDVEEIARAIAGSAPVDPPPEGPRAAPPQGPSSGALDLRALAATLTAARVHDDATSAIEIPRAQPAAARSAPRRLSMPAFACGVALGSIVVAAGAITPRLLATHRSAGVASAGTRGVAPRPSPPTVVALRSPTPASTTPVPAPAPAPVPDPIATIPPAPQPERSPIARTRVAAAPIAATPDAIPEAPIAPAPQPEPAAPLALAPSPLQAPEPEPEPTTAPVPSTPPSVDALLAAAFASPPSPTPTPAADAPSPSADRDVPTRADLELAMAAVAPDVRACGEGAHGIATVRITITGATGRVRSALVEGTFAGTPIGSCAARAIREASFAPFARETFVVVYPFRI